MAKLVARETRRLGEETTAGERTAEKEGREKREEVWWETWREMGCDLERGGMDIWPVGKMRRRETGSM